MKIILGVISFILSVFIADMLVDKYKKRYLFYEHFNTFLISFNKQMNFSKNSIKNIIDDEKIYGDFKNIVIEVIYNNKNIDKKYLSSEEKTYAEEILKNLGNGNRSVQTKFVEEIITTINDKLEDSKKEYKKNKSLYIKVGIFLGLIMFIALL